MAQTPEGKVKSAVKKLLDEYKPFVRYRMYVPGGFGKTTLDFEVLYRGRFLAVETKAPNKPWTARQMDDALEIVEAGGSVMLIDGTSHEHLGALKLWLEDSTP